ncbi:drug/metabolite transporter (DMT)-like permease [Mesocricetibacter intestinalis]|uniref:Drug/metabolite transporter (DMT)-like permease n=1 Tax=Mesocricetibacter intestinalis TaxID=1521930 RepID=A0A4R6VG14_9PAST|nr:DMT family transporter [Mesocricetibacter intestinalis]TDQ59739.1 drug/metabolite transporter (DMT)-like permease [Mesocricetibacter intestinalis]
MQQKPLLGFTYALIAVLMWGMLPIAVKQLVTAMNSQTIVFYRFIAAAVGLSLFMAWRGNLPRLGQLNRRFYRYILLGIFGLSGNFFLFNLGLNYISASTSQVMGPLGSFMMLFASVKIFKEQMGAHQKIGLLILIIGLLMFFNDRFDDFARMNLYFKGVLIAFIASVIWVVYGISQKMLLYKFSAQQILLVIYIGCALLFTPFADKGQVFTLTPFQFACLLFCCANTLIAYGCYAEALNLWEVSKVSAMMTQIPVFTIIFSELLFYLAPQFFADQQLNTLSYCGAAFVVSGALFSAVGHKFFNRIRQG